MPFRRLAALLVGVVVLATGATAIALAASGGGPVPPAKPLDRAARDALNAPSVPGVTARIKFTNRLIDSGGLEGASPILTGASGRLWYAEDGRVRLELQSSGGDAQVVFDRGRIWAYDASSNTVYRGSLPRGRGEHSGSDAEKPVSLADVQRAITDIAGKADLSGAIPGDVGGRPVYEVRLSPKRDGGLVGAGALAWDAVRGVPLRVAIYAAGDSTPVLELEATDGRIDEALDTVELTGRAKDRVGGYSHGMRQRLGIAAALLRAPKLMLLDEPATGLDPGGMRDMRALIRRLADEGMTVLLSSHLLAEVEELCNRVAIVRSGSIVYEGTIADLKRTAAATYHLSTTDDERALAVCRAQGGISHARTDVGGIVFRADESAVPALSLALVEADVLIKALAPQTVKLEDLFFALTEGEPAPSAPPAPIEEAA